MQEHVQAAAAALQESRTTAPKDGSDPSLLVPYQSLRGPSSNLRVNKWDALILDSEILGLLKTPMKSMFSMFEPGIVDRIKPEIDAALGALLFVFTTGLGRVRGCFIANAMKAGGCNELSNCGADYAANAGNEAGERPICTVPPDSTTRGCLLLAVGRGAVRVEALVSVPLVCPMDG